jgi:signal transduction histidine kinase
VWNQNATALDFSIAPAYFQTTRFRLLCAALAVALLWTAYRLRVRQLAHQFNMKLDARVDERTRIARELHDTILQNFQGVLLQLRAALRFLSREPHKAQEVLASAIDQAAAAIKGGREAVQGLRASARESNDLAAAIGRLGQDLAAGQTGEAVPALRVDVEGAPRDLHPIIRDEIFRVAGEALRNAMQHSHGTRVEVDLWYDLREFRLRVRDDGQGINQDVLATGGREGHFGLRGMRERAVRVGGKLSVWSTPGAGAEVELIVPGSKAYALARRSPPLGSS